MANDAVNKVFFEENMNGLSFSLRGVIDQSKRQLLTFLKFNMMIKLQSMVREFAGFCLLKPSRLSWYLVGSFEQMWLSSSAGIPSVLAVQSAASGSVGLI